MALGLLGTLLSTPLTVCLAVLGKYVPSLRFYATILGEEAEVGPRYQVLPADGLARRGRGRCPSSKPPSRNARVPRSSIRSWSRHSRAGRDVGAGELEESDMTFIRRVTSAKSSTIWTGPRKSA